MSLRFFGSLSALFAIMMLSLACTMPQSAHAQTSPSTIFLNDTFNSDLDGWQYFGGSGYSLALDSTTGQPAPSAHISGDAWTGTCSPFGMEKAVNIGQYTGGPLTLALNWRASSTSGADSTTADVEVDDASTGKVLFTHAILSPSPTYDTGWQFYANDISSYVSGVKNIQVKLFLYDCWSVNWSENNWYDNVQLFEGALPPGQPTGLTANELSSSQIYLNWTAPMNTGGSPVTSYKIERTDDNGTTWSAIVSSTGSNATSYTDSGLSPSTTYGYRVSAINIAGTSSPSTAAYATTISSQAFLNDNFNSDLNGWQYSGTPGYTLSLDSTTGVPSPSAHISGDAWTGTCSPFGMSKQVNISQYLGGPLILALNWRATSSYTGSATTNAEVSVNDAVTGQQLYIQRLVNGGTTDTGWQHFAQDISKNVSTSRLVTVNLHLYDCWTVNWNENNWYDNVQLYASQPLPTLK